MEPTCVVRRPATAMSVLQMSDDVIASTQPGALYTSGNGYCGGANRMMDRRQEMYRSDRQEQNAATSGVLVTVDLVKGQSGFGFSLADTSKGQVVKRITEPDKCRDVCVGDVIVAINGSWVRDCSHHAVVGALRRCERARVTKITLLKSSDAVASVNDESAIERHRGDVLTPSAGSCAADYRVYNENLRPRPASAMDTNEYVASQSQHQRLYAKSQRGNEIRIHKAIQSPTDGCTDTATFSPGMQNGLGNCNSIRSYSYSVTHSPMNCNSFNADRPQSCLPEAMTTQNTAADQTPRLDTTGLANQKLKSPGNAVDHVSMLRHGVSSSPPSPAVFPRRSEAASSPYCAKEQVEKTRRRSAEQALASSSTTSSSSHNSLMAFVRRPLTPVLQRRAKQAAKLKGKVNAADGQRLPVSPGLTSNGPAAPPSGGIHQNFSGTPDFIPASVYGVGPLDGLVQVRLSTTSGYQSGNDDAISGYSTMTCSARNSVSSLYSAAGSCLPRDHVTSGSFGSDWRSETDENRSTVSSNRCSVDESTVMEFSNAHSSELRKPSSHNGIDLCSRVAAAESAVGTKDNDDDDTPWSISASSKCCRQLLDRHSSLIDDSTLSTNGCSSEFVESAAAAVESSSHSVPSVSSDRPSNSILLAGNETCNGYNVRTETIYSSRFPGHAQSVSNGFSHRNRSEASTPTENQNGFRFNGASDGLYKKYSPNVSKSAVEGVRILRSRRYEPAQQSASTAITQVTSGGDDVIETTINTRQTTQVDEQNDQRFRREVGYQVLAEADNVRPVTKAGGNSTKDFSDVKPDVEQCNSNTRRRTDKRNVRIPVQSDATLTERSKGPAAYHNIDLHRGSRGFGFSIRGGKEFDGMSLYVLNIAKGGPADMDGRLMNEDELVAINGVNCGDLTHADAVGLIQNSCSPLRLLVRRVTSNNVTNEQQQRKVRSLRRSVTPSAAVDCVQSCDVDADVTRRQ